MIKSIDGTNTFSRRIRESIEIRKKGAKAINRDEGIYTLDHVYDSLLKPTIHLLSSAGFPGKAVNRSTCDQAISHDGES